MTPTDPQADVETPSETDAPPLAAFESSIAELESLVESLESGDVALEQALAQFERGVVLTRQCQAMLKSAELHVDQLLGEDDEAHTAPLPDETRPADPDTST